MTQANVQISTLAADLLRRTVLENPFIPVTPTPIQAVALTSPVSELLFGAAAGPGKTTFLLMAGLQYAPEPGYHALLLRRTYPQLEREDGLIPKSHEWLQGTGATYDNGKHEWRFPAGGSLTFGFLDTENDKYNWQGPAFHFIGFDELTQFTEGQYRYLFSRRRKLVESQIPLRMRAATNPGGVGHEWVKRRFINSLNPDRLVIRAKIADNPHLDRASYEESLKELDPVTRRQLQHGDWNVTAEGNLFKRAWFAGKIVDGMPGMIAKTCRGWDLASTQDGGDATAGVRISSTTCGRYLIEDVRHERLSPRGVKQLVNRTAHADGYDVEIRMEQEPGSSGVTVIDDYRTDVLQGFNLRGVRSTGDKIVRAGAFSSACEAGNVYLKRAPWNDAYLDELCAFPEGGNDDQVDGSTLAFNGLRSGLRDWTEEDWQQVFSDRRDRQPRGPLQILQDKIAKARRPRR